MAQEDRGQGTDLVDVVRRLERIEKKIDGNFPKGWAHQREFIIAALRALDPDPKPGEVDFESKEPVSITFEFSEPVLIGFRTKNCEQNVSSKRIICSSFGIEAMSHSIDCFETFWVPYEDIFSIGRHLNLKELSQLE